jgi:iron complex transport system permease protein
MVVGATLPNKDTAMKVTLDLDQLLQEGAIPRAAYDRFSQLAARGTASLAFNILVGFGVIAVAGAALALLPTPVTAIALGLTVCAAGVALVYARDEQWTVLANICMVVGALLFGGGVIAVWNGSLQSFLLVAAGFGAAGVFARSSLMVVLAVLALASAVGARTGYWHATYALGIAEPALTVALFTAFSIATYQLSKGLAADYQRLAIAASRTGVVLVNFGFWIGSLWGDRTLEGEVVIPDWVFAGAWAIVLLAAAIWAWQQNRRWLVNVVAVFGGIHFYTVVRAPGRVRRHRADRRSARAGLCDRAADAECPTVEGGLSHAFAGIEALPSRATTA